MYCETTFEELYPGVFERICYNAYGDQSDNDIKIVDRVQRDKINFECVAEYRPTPNKLVKVRFRDGDLDGSVVIEFGEEVEAIKQFKTTWDYEPLSGKRAPLFEKKLKAMKTRLDEQVEKWLYDEYHSPTNKINKHYTDYFKSIGVKVIFGREEITP